MKKIRIFFLSSILWMFSIVIVNAVPLPQSYPTITTTTKLILLDDQGMIKAKNDTLEVNKRVDDYIFWDRDQEEWVSAPGYYLGYNENGIMNKKTSLSYGLITPYSAARYINYKSESSYALPNPEVLNQLKQYQNIAYLVIYPLVDDEDRMSLSRKPVKIVSVSIIVGDKVYPSLPKDIYLPKIVSVIANHEQLWPFPIDLFSTDSEAIEIQTLDAKGSERRWKIPAKRYDLIQ